MMKNTFSLPLKLQVGYAAFCVAWNVIALAQLQLGLQPIGPTASILVILVAVVLVLLLNISLLREWRLSYLLLSGLIFVAALAAVHSGITKSADLWPSVFWRFAGIAVNLLGVISFFVVITTFLKRR